MFDVGRVCVKTKGRDANSVCVVVDAPGNDGRALIDGNTRRRKVNTAHLEPRTETVDVKKGASTDDVLKALSKLGVKVKDTSKKKVRKPKAEKPAEKKSDAPAKKAEPAKEKAEKK